MHYIQTKFFAFGITSHEVKVGGTLESLSASWRQLKDTTFVAAAAPRQMTIPITKLEFMDSPKWLLAVTRPIRFHRLSVGK